MIFFSNLDMISSGDNGFTTGPLACGAEGRPGAAGLSAPGGDVVVRGRCWRLGGTGSAPEEWTVKSAKG